MILQIFNIQYTIIYSRSTKLFIGSIIENISAFKESSAKTVTGKATENNFVGHRAFVREVSSFSFGKANQRYSILFGFFFLVFFSVFKFCCFPEFTHRKEA